MDTNKHAFGLPRGARTHSLLGATLGVLNGSEHGPREKQAEKGSSRTTDFAPMQLLQSFWPTKVGVGLIVYFKKPKVEWRRNSARNPCSSVAICR